MHLGAAIARGAAVTERLNPLDRPTVERVTKRAPDWQTWAMMLDVANRLRLIAKLDAPKWKDGL
jgi:hypothetical protein